MFCSFIHFLFHKVTRIVKLLETLFHLFFIVSKRMFYDCIEIVLIFHETCVFQWYQRKYESVLFISNSIFRSRIPSTHFLCNNVTKECIFCSHFKAINIIFRPNPQKEYISYHYVSGNNLCLLFQFVTLEIFIWHSFLFYCKIHFLYYYKKLILWTGCFCSIFDQEKLTNNSTLHSFIVEKE